MADRKGEKKWMFVVRLVLLDFRLVVRLGYGWLAGCKLKCLFCGCQFFRLIFLDVSGKAWFKSGFTGCQLKCQRGGFEWYQSIGLIFLYISANFLLFFKGPRPFKSQKTNFSGLTTQYAPRLN
jgi:hypothetical protein